MDTVTIDRSIAEEALRFIVRTNNDYAAQNAHRVATFRPALYHHEAPRVEFALRNALGLNEPARYHEFLTTPPESR